MKTEKQGYYCPDLIIHHVMQQARLNRDYFRQWSKRDGRNRVVADRMNGTRNAATHRWYWWQFARDMLAVSQASVVGKRHQPDAFEAELNLRFKLAHLWASLSGK
jgi:hypothetical protein